MKVKELHHSLQTEKASRTDLEMYVAVLNTQKGVLQEDVDKLRSQLHERKPLRICHNRDQHLPSLLSRSPSSFSSSSSLRVVVLCPKQLTLLKTPIRNHYMLSAEIS